MPSPRPVDHRLAPIADQLRALAQLQGGAAAEPDDPAALLAAIGAGDQLPLPAFAVVCEILFHLLHANPPQSALTEFPK